MLRNRLGVGELNHKGASYPGEHAPIVTPALFDAVQERLTSNRTGARVKQGPEYPVCRNCVVVEAVVCEPVSRRGFPALREICRENSHRM
jgi:hypothetical protein